MNVTAKVSNLALPRISEFTPDELSLIIGMCTRDAVAVIDRGSSRIVGGNRRFEDLLDRSLEGDEELEFDDFVHPEDRGIFKTWAVEDLTKEDACFELRLFSKSGAELHVDVFLSTFRWKRIEYLIAYLYPSPSEDVIETELKRKVAEQKRKTLEAIKSSLLIYQFTEKIKKTPVLTANLLSTEDESQLFERAARILAGEGLNYKDVTFYIVEDNSVSVRHSTKTVADQRFPIEADNRYAEFIRSEQSGLKTMGNEILVPLQSRGSVLGLIAVTMHARERIFFDELNLVSSWQKDALLTIGDTIALLLENLRLYREVRRQSITDMLTGVYNRHYFMTRLSSEMSRCRRNALPISLIFVDVDKFKEINDTYGHLQGDEILKTLGRILDENVREYDVVCRFGGDEFVVLLPEVGQEAAQAIAGKLLERVREYDFAVRQSDRTDSISLSVSIGVSEMNDSSETDFLKRADDALYRAKAGGRDQLSTS